MVAIVLAAYTVLLLVGGVFGYVKAGSRVSLITAVPFAIALAICAWVGEPHGLHVALGLQGILLVVFSLRFLKTRKFMPAGLMGAVTLLAVLLELGLRGSGSS